MTVYECYEEMQDVFMEAYRRSDKTMWLDFAKAVFNKKLSLSAEEAEKEYDREKLIREVLNGRIG